MPFGNPGPFPIPGLSTTYGTGPQWLKMHQFQPAFSEQTIKHVYEDGGASFQTFIDLAPIRFLIEYDGIDNDDLAVIDDHRADAFGEVYGFNFTNPRTSVTYTDVHYDEQFEEDHKKTWYGRRVISLIKRPA